MRRNHSGSEQQPSFSFRQCSRSRIKRNTRIGLLLTARYDKNRSSAQLQKVSKRRKQAKSPQKRSLFLYVSLCCCLQYFYTDKALKGKGEDDKALFFVCINGYLSTRATHIHAQTVCRVFTEQRVLRESMTRASEKKSRRLNEEQAKEERILRVSSRQFRIVSVFDRFFSDNKHERDQLLQVLVLCKQATVRSPNKICLCLCLIWFAFYVQYQFF